jgi:hypothetical protein
MSASSFTARVNSLHELHQEVPKSMTSGFPAADAAASASSIEA